MSQWQLPIVIMGLGIGYGLPSMFIYLKDVFIDWQVGRRNEKYFAECEAKGISPFPNGRPYFVLNYNEIIRDCPKCGEKL